MTRPPMNTRISYLYRDASNYKAHHDVVVHGEITFAQIESALESGQFFIPSQVGLPDLQAQLGPANDDDHAWHELTPDSFSPTEDPPTVGLTARKLRVRFRQVQDSGWDLLVAMTRNRMSFCINVRTKKSLKA